MSRTLKVPHFDSEGKNNLPQVIKSVRNYLRTMINTGLRLPSTIVFFTSQGEGPMMAYNQLSGLNMQIVAVTFPPHYSIKLSDGTKFFPVIPDKVKKFFAGVEIPIITSRLPFDEIEGVELQNKEMAALRNSIAIFGGSMPLAVQAVLQATDHGLLEIGDEVIAVTADTAVLITASTTQRFLNKECGLMVNEIICKPRNFTVSRPLQGKGSSIELKGKLEKASIELAETSRHGPGQS